MNLPLFAPPAPLIPETREERQAVLDSQVPPPVKALRIARAICDPCAHLADCPDPACSDCAALIEQGFRQCSRCQRWAHRACLYPEHPASLAGSVDESSAAFEGDSVKRSALICSGCMIADCRPLDGREVRYEWIPPAALTERSPQQ